MRAFEYTLVKIKNILSVFLGKNKYTSEYSIKMKYLTYHNACTTYYVPMYSTDMDISSPPFSRGDLATSWFILLSGAVFIEGSMFLPRAK